MDSSSQKRRRGRPAQSEQVILDDDSCLNIALQAFAERGYEGASIREIAAACGISHGLLNSRFGSKQVLWEAAVDLGMLRLHTRMVDMQNQISPDLDVEIRLRAVCADFLESLATYPAIVQLMNVEGARASTRLDYIVQTFLRELSWPIRTLLDEGIEKGVFRNVHITLPFTLLAHGAGALVALRPLVESVDPSLEKTPAAISQTIADAADFIVRGLKL